MSISSISIISITILTVNSTVSKKNISIIITVIMDDDPIKSHYYSYHDYYPAIQKGTINENMSHSDRFL